MINKREIISIITASIILAFVITFLKDLTTFLYALGAVFFIIIINTAGKKWAAHAFDSEIEVKIWEEKNYMRSPNKLKGQKRQTYYFGILIPAILSIVSFGYIKWMAALIFDVKATVYRAAKHHGLYAFSELTEWDLGLIAATGIFVTLIASIIGYFIGFPSFTKYGIYYAAFNLIPFGNLDGNKIFFGSVVIWSFLVILTLIGLFYTFILI